MSWHYVLHASATFLYVSDMSRLLPSYTINQAQVGLSARQPVRSEDISDVLDIAPHDHAYYEISIVWGGHARHTTSEGYDTLRAGSVVVIPPGGVHAFFNCAGLCLTNIYYLSEWLLLDLPTLWGEGGLVPLFLASSLFPNAPSLYPSTFTLSEGELVRVSHEVEALHDEMANPRPSLIFTKASLLKLLVLLLRAQARMNTSRQVIEFRKEVWTILNTVETAIMRGEGLHVTALANALGVSADHLSRLFKEVMGSSIEPYFQRRRVQRACTMLLDPKATVTEVAYALGYADASHLSRLFKKHVGVSPTSYRNEFRV